MKKIKRFNEALEYEEVTYYIISTDYNNSVSIEEVNLSTDDGDYDNDFENFEDYVNYIIKSYTDEVEQHIGSQAIALTEEMYEDLRFKLI